MSGLLRKGLPLICVEVIWMSIQEGQEAFPLVVDHTYLWVDKGAPQMKLLENVGLQPYGNIQVHEGQGTASQAVLFKNMYLELAWVENEQELTDFIAGGGVATAPPKNWQETGESPFGVGLHYRTEDTPHLPIKAKNTASAEWMPEGSSIQEIEQTSPYAPIVFILHGPLAYWDCPEKETTHDLGAKFLTGVTITVTRLDNLDQLTPQLSEHGVVALKEGDMPLLELTFDDHVQGKTLDFRPAMPLIINC